MKHYNKSKKHYNNKKSKGKQKTKKMKMKGGDLVDYFTKISFKIPGFGSVGKCQDRPIWNWKTKQNDIQKCYITPFGPVYKTVQSDTGAVASGAAASGAAANGAATTNTKAWYNFW